MTKFRDNHYVPQWYQRGFLFNPTDRLYYLDLNPDQKTLPDGRVITMNSLTRRAVSQCFYKTDLYTTFFGPYINDEIEKKLFGEIDNTGSKAVWAFIGEEWSKWHTHFSNFFAYMDSQKIRTPKGLDWIGSHYPNLTQIELMREMQGIRHMHCTIWTEGVREIVSAKESAVKFILSDHPVTIYNHACPPDVENCTYPNDPPITFKGSQTIFPLDKNHCLILTNYEYAKKPDSESPLEKRTFARLYRNSVVRTDAFIRTRAFGEEDVKKINKILKARARRYIGAAEKEWLYPEKTIRSNWAELRQILLPPKDELWHFGGETIVGYEDGTSYYQDAFGRTTSENKYFKKPKNKKPLKPNDHCGCGSGRKFKKCCQNKRDVERPSWDELSIRERNILFFNGIAKILGFDKGKTWDDVRKELSSEQVNEIHELYGFLWPIETDIISLLPKPDKTARALYTGIIDPRVIHEFATSSTLYFDELIIQSPILHPDSVKPEYSPVHNPLQYKQQTLKNIYLFMMLIPFIEEGYINFIPDPCAFDGYLRRQMFHMAEARAPNRQIPEKDFQLMKWLSLEDFKRTMGMCSKEHQIMLTRQAAPHLSDGQIEEALRYMEEKKQKDPLALLQDDVLKKDGGQFTMMNLSPNFEISLFLCQATGAFLFTDSHYRWEEMKGAQYRESGKVIYNWERLTSYIRDLEFPFIGKPEITFQLRKGGKLGELRKALKAIYGAIQENKEQAKFDCLIETLMKEFGRAHELAKKEIGKLEDEQYKFNGKFEYLIPNGGIVHNNVQRMLLSSGNDNHLDSVPMALLVEHAQTKENE